MFAAMSPNKVVPDGIQRRSDVQFPFAGMLSFARRDLTKKASSVFRQQIESYVPLRFPDVYSQLLKVRAV